MTRCVDSEKIDPRLWILFGALSLAVPSRVLAQTARAAAAPASVPASDPLPVQSDSGSSLSHEAQLETRIRQLEGLIRKMPDPEHVRRLEERLKALPDPEHVRQLKSTIQQLTSQVDQLSTKLRQNEARWRIGSSGTGTAGGRSRSGAVAAMPTTAGLGDATGPDDSVGRGGDEEVIGGASDVGPTAELPSPRFDMPEPMANIPLVSRLGPGFQFQSRDDEFDLQFHNLTQADGQFFGRRDQTTSFDTFNIAREWLIFSGHLTRPYDYYLSLTDAAGSFNVLDVFLNVNYDKRFQFRLGRFKSPFTYEFYGEPTQGLANGEWSLFFNNFGMARDVGTMLWGESVAGRIDYAAGIFNSAPNSQIDLSNHKSVIAFLNFAPFRPAKDSPLENLNVGGSLVAGEQDFTPQPSVMRTIVPTSGSNMLGAPFLTFNNNVIASGQRNLWDLHAAYYYGGLSLIGEWGSGFEDYDLANTPTRRTRVPIGSYYVQAAYFLTGERVASRGMVKPRRPFDLRKGRFGPGAWEVAFRYNSLDLGKQVFTAGLADPTLWTDRLYTTDIGINWYWNQYIRVLFDWQHAGFGSQVIYRPGGFARTSDLFLLRIQIWF